MSEPRNQHWLPQFYLRRFAIPGFGSKQKAKIWMMDKEKCEVRWTKVRDVAAADFLYSHTKEDGTRCFRVEKELAELENIIARLYPRIADGYPDLSAAWGIKKFAALFVASLMVRHPEEQAETLKLHSRMVDFYEKEPKDADGRPLISHIIEDGKAYEFDNSNYADYKAADENRLKQVFAEQIHPLAVSMTDVLVKKRWAFLCTDEPAFFTSDRPVIQRHTETHTYGIATPGVHLWFPISPTRMLWMSDRVGEQPDGYYPLPMSKTAGLNAFTLGNATRFLLSHDHPDARLKHVGVLADEMYQRFGPPRPLDGPIWKMR